MIPLSFLFRLLAVVACIASATEVLAASFVDPRSGELVVMESDLLLPVGPVDLQVRRIFRSGAIRSGLLGKGWLLSWEKRLDRAGDTPRIDEAEGETAFPSRVGQGEFRSAAGEKLSIDDSGGATRTFPNGDRETYDPQGRMSGLDLGNGNVFRFAYTLGGPLARIEGPGGRFVRLVMGPGGDIEAIETSDGKRIEYAYAQGRLARAARRGGPAKRYDYDAEGRLSRIDDPETGPVEVRYDERGRVQGTRLSDGAEVQRRYELDGRRHRVTDPAGATTTIEWSADGRRDEITDPLGRKTVTERDEGGRPLSVTGPTGLVSRCTYDALGRLAAFEDARGETTRYEYLGETGLVRRVGLPDGSEETMEYDGNRNLVSLREGGETVLAYTYRTDGLPATLKGRGIPGFSYSYDKAGRLQSLGTGEQTTRFERDARGNLVRQTGPDGGVFEWRYDGLDRPAGVTAPDGGKWEWAYDAAGRLSAERDPTGASTLFRYDVRGRLSGVTYAAGRTTRLEYDAAGRIVARIDGAGNAERYEYDAAGNLVRHTNPLGGATSWTYDASGNPTTVTDPAGGKWRYEWAREGVLSRAETPGGAEVRYRYDPRGRLVAAEGTGFPAARFEHDAKGRITRLSSGDGWAAGFRYDAAGNLAVGTDELGRQVRREYDPQGRLASERAATGLSLEYRYDRGGRPNLLRDSLGNTQRMEYDAMGRLAALTAPGGGTTKFRHDLLGRLVEVTDPLGAATRFAYSPAGELAGATDPGGDRVSSLYDGAGHLREVRTPGGGTVRFDRDAMGNILEETDASGARTGHVYDESGRLLARTDAGGQTIHFRYDAAGRLTEKRLPDGVLVRFRYDPAGNLLEADDGRFPVRCVYDDMGRRTRIEYPALKRVLQYAYDDAGRLARFTDSEGRSVAYEYDAMQRLSAIRIAPDAVFSYSYDVADRPVEVAFPNGVRGTRRYDADGRLASLAYADGKGRTLASWSYAYDAAGKLESVTDSRGRVTRFRYDACGRLIEEAGPSAAVRMGYLPGGNRARLEKEGVVTEYRYDEADRLLMAGDEKILHDAAGNVVERRGARGITRYRYDAENRLVGATRPGRGEVSFGYAPTGERIWRKDESGTTWFVTDGVNLLAELDGDLAAKAAYLHGPGIDQPLAWLSGDRRLYFHADGFGGVASLTGSGGQEEASFGTDAFGNPRESRGKESSPFLFAGREYDRDLGLYYFRARYYDPGLGRFLSADPVPPALEVPADWNRYVYARSAPTRFQDPWGTNIFDDSVPPKVFGKSFSYQDIGYGTPPAAAPNPVSNPANLSAPVPSTSLPFYPSTGTKGWPGAYEATVPRTNLPGGEFPGGGIKVMSITNTAKPPPGSYVNIVPRPNIPGVGDPGYRMVMSIPQSPGPPTGYSPLTSGKSSFAQTPSVASRIGGAASTALKAGGVALTIASSLKTGYDTSRERLLAAETQALRNGRLSLGRWERERVMAAGAAGLEAGARSGAMAASLGMSETALAIGTENYYQQRDWATQNQANRQREYLKEKILAGGSEYTRAFKATAVSLVKEAETLDRKQQEDIREARAQAIKAREAAEVLEKTDAGALQSLCPAAASKVDALKAMPGRMSAEQKPLEGLREKARESSQSVCAAPPGSETVAQLANARAAAEAAEQARNRMAKLVNDARGLAQEASKEADAANVLAEKIAKVTEARGAGAEARRRAVEAKELPQACLSLQNRAYTLSENTPAETPEKASMAQYHSRIKDICESMYPRASEGESYARLAESSSDRIDAILAKVGTPETCDVEVPLGLVAELSRSANAAMALVTEAREQRDRAEGCVKSAEAKKKLLDEKTPKAVRESRTGSPDAKGDPVQILLLTEQGETVEYQGRTYRKLLGQDTVVAQVRYADGSQNIISGNKAFLFALRSGYYRFMEGVGMVRTGMAMGRGIGGNVPKPGVKSGTASPGAKTPAGAKPPAGPAGPVTGKPPTAGSPKPAAPTGGGGVLIGVDYKSLPPVRQDE